MFEVDFSVGDGHGDSLSLAPLSLGDPESILICLYVELNDPKMTQEEFYISLQTLF